MILTPEQELEKVRNGRDLSCFDLYSVNCFFENSTRTLASFDLAAKHLSMDTTSVGGSSSVKKWESYLDTAQTLDAYNSKVIVVRSSEAW